MFARPPRQPRRPLFILVRSSRVVCAWLAAACLSALAAHGQDAPQVLILNSYHPGYGWSDGEQRGVIKALNRAFPKLLPGIEYLDWKRQPTEAHAQLFLDSLQLKYGGLDLRVVITLDDKAFELVLQNRALFGGEDVAIVFGGVNYLDPAALREAGHDNVTGVVESKDMAGTLDLIQRLQPEVEELVGFHDDTESSLANRRSLEEAARVHAPKLRLSFIENWSRDELFTALGYLGPKNAAISLGAGRDRNGVLLADDTDYLNDVARHCPVPIYLISEPIVPLFGGADWDAAVWSGVGGSLATSDLHGEQVGDLAVRVLRGERADAIPIVTASPGRLAVDWRQMRRFDLSLDALPEGTEVFHRPQSFYVVNKSRIIAGLATLAVLAITVVVLTINTLLRRRAERQNRRLIAAVEQTSDMIVMMDADRVIHYTNPAFTRITGLSLTAARVQPPEFLDASTTGRGFARIATDLETRENLSIETTFQHRDGHHLQLSFVVTVVRNPDGDLAGYILIARDITRETRLEEQVRISQKMEAIGLMAGGVAHDFNNLLQVIIGHTHFALQSDLSEEIRLASLKQVLATSERAAQLPRQLLAFGRRQPLQMRDTDLNQVTRRFLGMIRRVIGEQIEVDFIPGHQLGNIHADQSQLEQILLNLCVNARDAMPGGGKLVIALENISIDGAYCEVHLWARPGQYVLLRVSDTGCGMDQTTLGRIFDPFFTTKPVGKGTGLGLAVVYGIVQQHEGFVHVYSEPGRGTTFKVYLPISERRVETVGNQLPAVPAEPGQGTILLVEDDEAVRDLAHKILRQAGHRVLQAENGQEAVRCFEENADIIQLVVMDVVMPKMSGPEAYSRMAVIRPGTPVLFCSGYSADSLHPGFGIQPGAELIQKPYDPAVLRTRVAEQLRKARPPSPGSTSAQSSTRKT